MSAVLSPRVRPSKVLTSLLLIAVAILASPAGVLAILTTASVASLTLAPVTSSHVAQTSTGTMTLTVTDSLPSLGWNVTILSSAFVYSGSFGGTSIPAANFSITMAATPVRVLGQAIDPTGGPKVPSSGATGALDVARKTIQAELAFGVGTYTQVLGVSLVVPADSRAGTYTASLTVTAAAAP